MKGGLIINLWSEFIKQKAEETGSSYESVSKKFWKSSLLKKEWNNYKKRLVRDFFVPTPSAVPFNIAPIPMPTYVPDLEILSKPDVFRSRNVGESFAELIEKEPNIFLNINEINAEEQPSQKKRGRPKGSTNKPKMKPPAPAIPSNEAINQAVERGLMSLEDFNMEKTRPKMGSLERIKANLMEKQRRENELFGMRMEDYPAPAQAPTEDVRETLYKKYIVPNSNKRFVPEREVRDLGIPIEKNDVTGQLYTYLVDPKTKSKEFFWLIRDNYKPLKGKGFEDWLPFIRKNYPPSIRSFLAQRGNEVIESLTIARTPLQLASNLLLQTITSITMGGLFQKRQKEKNYDDLFHLELLITTTSGTFFSIEKNEVINIRINPKLQTNTQLEEVEQSTIPIGLTISQMLNNAEKRMGKKFFVYNAVTNNCQDFVLALLEANGMGTQEDKNFIKQDIPFLFAGAKKTISFASLLTSLASIRNRLIEGEGLYKVQSVLFDKSKWDASQKASDWLKSHSYVDKGVDEKQDTYRFRQLNPQYIRKKGYKRFITKPLGDSGVSLILAYKN